MAYKRDKVLFRHVVGLKSGGVTIEEGGHKRSYEQHHTNNMKKVFKPLAKIIATAHITRQAIPTSQSKR